MNYFKLMAELFDMCISQVDDSGLYFLTPHWRKIVNEFNASDEIAFSEHLKNENITDDVLEDILKLEVDRRNAYIDKKIEIRNWVFDLITSVVEPEILQEETDYIKNVMEYMKLNDSLKEKEKELEEKENTEKNKKKLDSIIPKGMTFKKGIQ